MLLHLILFLVVNPLTVNGSIEVPSFENVTAIVDTIPEASDQKIFNPGNEVFKVVESMPRFPGCEPKLDKKELQSCSDKKRLRFTYSNIRYPAEAREKGIQGTAVVKFIVEKDGSITNIELVQDPGAGIGEESLRVVRSMVEKNIKWIPGKQNGVPVRVEYTLPIKFSLV